jgi:hypothetical protein
VARLTAQEEAILARLAKKREAPDPGPVGRSVSVTVNLGDSKQVALAQKLGLFDLDDDEPDEPNDTTDEPDDLPDDTPKRRGFFPDS